MAVMVCPVDSSNNSVLSWQLDSDQDEEDFNEETMIIILLNEDQDEDFNEENYGDYTIECS